MCGALSRRPARESRPAPPATQLWEGVAPLKIDLTARNLEVSDDLRDYVKKKLGKIEKSFERSSVAQVVLTSEGKDRQIAEITLPVNGMYVRGEEVTDDIYASVNLAVDKIERQIAKYRARFERRKREGRATARSVAPEPGADGDSQVVKVKRFAMKPMTVDEAVMQMNLLGHDFFVFESAETEQVNVLYRRKDGNYGLIEPE